MERTDNFKLKLAEDTDTMRDMVNGINDNFRIIDEQMQNNILGVTPQLESILVENDCQGTNHGSIYSIKIQLEFLVGGERFSRTESFEYKSDIDGNYETEINTRAYTVYYIQAYNVDIENGGCHLRITSEEPTNYNLVFGKFETDSEGAYKEGSFEPIQNAFLEKEIKNAKENATANFSKLKINNAFIPCGLIKVENDRIIIPSYVKDGVYFPNENAFYQFADGQFADETDYYIYVSGNTVNVSTSSSETAFARFRHTAANDSFEFQYFCNPVFVELARLITANESRINTQITEINNAISLQGQALYSDLFAIIDELSANSEAYYFNENFVQNNYNVSYYDSLSTALSDIANDDIGDNVSNDENIMVHRAYYQGKIIPIITILKDYSELDSITISLDDLLINLNSKTINFTAASSTVISHTAGNLTIADFSESKNGQIEFTGIVASMNGVQSTSTGNIDLINVKFAMQGTRNTLHRMFFFKSSSKINIKNCSFELNTVGGTARVLNFGNSSNTPEIVIDGCNIAINHTNGDTCEGIYNYGYLNVSNLQLEGTVSDVTALIGIVNTCALTINDNNTTIICDAPNNDSSGNYSKAIAAMLVSGKENMASTTIKGGYYRGTHSALSAQHNTYVTGGTFISCSHGGIYFSNAGYEYYVENAYIGCQQYNGQFDFSSMNNSYLGCFYVGGGTAEFNSNIDVYLNNCTLLTATDSDTEKAFVMRGTDGEHNNSVYISNTTIPSGHPVRIDSGNFVVTGQYCDIDNAKNSTNYKYIKENKYINKVSTEENWELIDNVTIGANVREYHRSIDSNNDLLKLKGIKIFINAPQVTGASDKDPIKLAIHSDTEGTQDIYRLAYTNALGAVKCQANYTAKIQNGCWEDNCKMIVAGVPVLPTLSSTLFANYATEEDKPFIKSWTLSNTKGAGHYIPSGTEIKVFGIKI